MRLRWLLCTAITGGALSADAADVQLFGIHVPASGDWAVYARVSNSDVATPAEGITKVVGLSSVSINVLNNGGNTVTSATNALPFGTTNVSAVLFSGDPAEPVGYGFWDLRDQQVMTALGAEHIEGAQLTSYGKPRNTTLDSFVLQNVGMPDQSGSRSVGGALTSATSWLYPLTVAKGKYTPGPNTATGLVVNYPTGKGAGVLRDADPDVGTTNWYGWGNTEQASNTIVIDPRYHTGVLGTTPAGGISGTTYRAGIGDADLNGLVGLNDLVILANHYGSAGTWFDGDFDFNGRIELNDLVLLANAYGTPTFAADWAYAMDQISAVPEPTGALVSLTLGALGCLGRRKRGGSLTSK
ncbi:MAG TPA: hypothetical protein VEA69_05905 [Tepidisphaeraceae bacterium]|nr:hypothetical protein [Tepidisphaeraceae bacterium]